MSKSKKKKADKAASLQRAKTLRDLVELRNTTLGNIKVHLLGRDETGAPNEPNDIWDTFFEQNHQRSAPNERQRPKPTNIEVPRQDGKTIIT